MLLQIIDRALNRLEKQQLNVDKLTLRAKFGTLFSASSEKVLESTPLELGTQLREIPTVKVFHTSHLRWRSAGGSSHKKTCRGQAAQNKASKATREWT